LRVEGNRLKERTDQGAEDDADLVGLRGLFAISRTAAIGTIAIGWIGMILRRPQLVQTLLGGR